ncbi:MAG: Iron-sulfur assembly protein 1 [Piccolia ochrophora]|nr:MAG: Iron-sulfur assembly protein 1 [Piccolia ochrophora]
MSIPRYLCPLTSSSSTLFRFASFTSFSSPASRTCHYLPRTFSSSRTIKVSSKRELQTATAHRPDTLDSEAPPPRNTGIPDTSIAGGVPKVNETRPPRLTGEHEAAARNRSDEDSSVSITEGEAQKSKPTTATRSSVEAATSTPSSSSSPRPRSKLRPRKAAMTLTPTAMTHLRQLLSQPEPKLIRVGVKNRGCSGLAYHLEFVDKPGAFDETVEQDGVRVLVDSKALFSIIGSEMDWVEDKLNQRFVFRNPNIKEQCGCGESFMV